MGAITIEERAALIVCAALGAAMGAVRLVSRDSALAATGAVHA